MINDKMKTVFTVGVYDMLHIGHMLLFKKAKELGDRLVVAVQDGDYIKKYKPGTNMIYSTEERCYMVSAIKGPDQNHEGFQRAVEWCEEHNKDVVVIPRTEGISSTMLREYSRIK